MGRRRRSWRACLGSGFCSELLMKRIDACNQAGMPHVDWLIKWKPRKTSVCQLAAVSMNILRLMGQRALLGPDTPVLHSAKRRRIKTVVLELIYRAGWLIGHGRQLLLGLGANDRAAKVFIRSFAQFAPTV
jgi:hypothetical protein